MLPVICRIMRSEEVTLWITELLALKGNEIFPLYSQGVCLYLKDNGRTNRRG